DTVTLTLRERTAECIEVERVTPDRLAALSAREISLCSIRVGLGRRQLGEVFDVRGERSNDVRVIGDLKRVNGLGTGMRGGSLLIDGDAGSHVAAGLTGGLVEVRGAVGDDAAIG